MTVGSATSRPVERCQLCSAAPLQSVLWIGYVPPVSALPRIGAPAAEQTAYPLELLRCPACSLVQIGLQVDKEILFPKSYSYLSGMTRALRDNFAQLRAEAEQVVQLAPNDLVVDIGSNDGTLLGNFAAGGYRVLGIEPTRAGEIARKNGIETVEAFFTPAVARDIRSTHGAARLITAANVFAHADNASDMLDAALELLADDGVFVSETHYVLDLVESLQYDAIYHEHARHYSVESLRAELARRDLELFDVRRIPTHGGSIRGYAARRGRHEIAPSVEQCISAERAAGLVDGSAFIRFRDRVTHSKIQLHRLLGEIHERGGRVYGISAPSRASTLAIHTGLDEQLVSAIVEQSTSYKLDTYLPGTRIPIIDERALFEQQPEYALLFSWHITKELSAALRKKGYRGRFITPLPEPRILDLE